MHLTDPDKILVREIIVERVQTLLEQDKNILFSYLYRMDISEKDILVCLEAEDPVNALADIILAKQVYRLKTKHNNPSGSIDIDPNLKW